MVYTLGNFSTYGDKVFQGAWVLNTAKHIPSCHSFSEVKPDFFRITEAPGPKMKNTCFAMIGMFESMRTGKVSKPVIVHDKLGVDDPHDNPSLAID